MASDTPSMGAPSSAPSIRDHVSRFEDIRAQYDLLHGVIEAANDELGPGDGMSRRGARLLGAAEFMATRLDGEFLAAINAAYGSARS